MASILKHIEMDEGIVVDLDFGKADDNGSMEVIYSVLNKFGDWLEVATVVDTSGKGYLHRRGDVIKIGEFKDQLIGLHPFYKEVM